jgi:uncharacterized protein (TIGR03089 family)
MSTVLDLLARRLAADPAQPLITFYDDATGERTELSVKTYANWVSKTANLFLEELMLDPGDQLSIDLPPHWLGAVFVGGAWACGIDLVDVAPVVVVGPDGLESTAGTVLACALRPFAVRFAEPLPAGVLDHGVLWAGQSDVFSPTGATDLGAPAPDDRRVITDLDPAGGPGRELLAGLLAGTGSLVVVAHSDGSRWSAHCESERTTAAIQADLPTG